jgi:hypothetical protein
MFAISEKSASSLFSGTHSRGPHDSLRKSSGSDLRLSLDPSFSEVTVSFKNDSRDSGRKLKMKNRLEIPLGE